MKPRIDLTGRIFNDFTVESYVSKSNYICRCICGETATKRSTRLKNLDTTTYCNHKQPKNKRLVSIWNGMNRRCKGPYHMHYKNYGGRGIHICDEWKSVNNFIKWALKNGYKPELQIDRIDVNGHYEPSNCRWITLTEQARNRRTTVLTEDLVSIAKTFRNYGYSYSQISKKLDIHVNTVISALKGKSWQDIGALPV